MNKTPSPEDAKQRCRALDIGKSVIVQAPAGSGKTELLVRRYLKLLAVVEAPEQILAITFTRKATAEMRQRVSDALGADAAPDDGEMRELAAAARARDAKYQWHLTGNTRRLRIQTIDAFCNELVWRMPWSARFGSPPALADDAAPLYRQAAKRALDHLERNDRWSDAADTLLTRVDANWGRARDLLASMLASRDQWMRALGAGDLGADDRAPVERMWRENIDRELRGARAAFDALTPGQLAAWAELGAYAAARLADSGADSPALALRAMTEFPKAEHRHIDAWHGLAALALTQKGEVRKTVTKREGFPADDAEQKAHKARMLELLNTVRGHPAVADALSTVRALPRGRFDDAQWHSIDAVVKLLRVAAAELRLLFKERNQADYIELTQRAGLALGDAEAPTDLALAFDYQLTHILMDEFQDTSSAHLELLEKLTAGWQAGDGRTLFLVGDPMQSIYRFREAEVGNFLQARDSGVGDICLESVALEVNFRSVPRLVDWLNATFDAVLAERDDPATGAVRYAPAVAHVETKAGGVRIHPAVDGGPESEAEAIAGLIAQAQREDPEQHIAVLGRTRRHLTAIAAALRRREIAFHGRDLEKLGDRPAIRDLIALTRALVQPADRVAMLSLLRAPWCGLSLDDLSKLAAAPGVDGAATLPELWRGDQRIAALSDDGRARLAGFAAVLDAALQRRGRIGLRDNVESAWLALGGPATVDASDLDDCAKYLDLLSGMESAQVETTPAGLHQAAGELWAQGGAGARVELLTIHKAKGLEFDTVIVPRLHGRPRAPEKTLLRWRKLPGPGQLLLAPLPASGDPDDSGDPFYRYLARLEAQHQHYETGRLLYVACTRARRRLHLFGQAPSRDGVPCAPPAGSLLSLLWPSVAGEYRRAAGQTAADAVVAADAGEFRPRPLQRLPRDWRPPPLPPGVDAGVERQAGGEAEQLEFSWAGETARITGIVIHQILQQVDAIGWDAWRRRAAFDAQWRNQLLENGLPRHNLQAALTQIAAAIDNARDDPRAAWIFSPAHRDIRAEWPLTGVVEGRIAHVVIDRSFVDEHGARWVIDFKSSRHEGGNLDAFLDRERERHQPQMALYAEVVGALRAEQVKLGLYFPALRGWREWKSHAPGAP